MINVLSRDPRDVAPFALSAETGAHGFGRILASASTGVIAGELNLTRTDGWRAATGYDRQSGTLRWRQRTGASSLTALATYSRIDQHTAGTSMVSADDFRAAPDRNYTPISYREVEAARASVAWERLSGSTLLSVTPFARWNRMEMLPNWTLTFDPHISETGHASVGALIKVRRDFSALRTRAIAGLDLDYSPGMHREWSITTTRDAGVFTSWDRSALIYDYDVAFRSAAPYAQLELSPLTDVRVVAGLRHDRLEYDYESALAPTQEGQHRRPADTTVRFERLTPKIGAVWAAADELRLYGSYGHGFRAPSESQLFRQGRAASSLALRPVRAENVEVGAGGILFGRFSYDLALYRMRKRDDILSFTHADGSTESMNAGETLHRGIEIGAALSLPRELRVQATFSAAQHRYGDWAPRPDTDFAGNAMEAAPTRTATAGVSWAPARWTGLAVGIDAHHVGPFWMDAANTMRYDGHTTVAVRAEAPLTRRFSVFARLTNALDARYAELAQYTSARGAEYAPGAPRALHVGGRFN
jgi:iron complex outermembrane receptor protein